MKNRNGRKDPAVLWCIAGLLLPLAQGCSTTPPQPAETGLARLDFSASRLPKDVYLAPWGEGSDKMPWMTSNPFRSKDQQVISVFEDGKTIENGNVTEVFLAAYWWGKPEESPVEIGVLALRFRDAAMASRAAKALQPQMDENARVEPHTAPTLLRRGSIVCILHHTSAVDKDVWSGMTRLVETALAGMR
jgi:hypothetical protein